MSPLLDHLFSDHFGVTNPKMRESDEDLIQDMVFESNNAESSDSSDSDSDNTP